MQRGAGNIQEVSYQDDQALWVSQGGGGKASLDLIYAWDGWAHLIQVLSAECPFLPSGPKTCIKGLPLMLPVLVPALHALAESLSVYLSLSTTTTGTELW